LENQEIPRWPVPPTAWSMFFDSKYYHNPHVCRPTSTD